MQSNNGNNNGQFQFGQQPKANCQQEQGQQQADANDLEQLSQRIAQLQQTEEEDEEEASHESSFLWQQMKIYLVKFGSKYCHLYHAANWVNGHIKVPPDEIDLYTRWLYTPRHDVKPRVLIFPVDSFMSHHVSSNVVHFINDMIKLQFSTAKRPCNFFIRLLVPDQVNNICMKNWETKERLMIKRTESNANSDVPADLKVALISRYPLGADKEWIESNEQEALHFDFRKENCRIHVDNPFTNAFPYSKEHDSHAGREAYYRSIRRNNDHSPVDNANARNDQEDGHQANDDVPDLISLW